MLGRVSGNQSANSNTGAGYVRFKHVAQDKLKMRSQEAGKYIDGYGMDVPGLGRDLRWLGSPDDHDNLEMHHEDAKEFVKRVKKHLEETQPKDEKDPLNLKRF